MDRWLLLRPGERFSDAGLLLARIACGSFLVYQSHDNVLSAARMAEFQVFLEAYGFWQPWVAAPLSVYAQFLAGIGFVLGALTRWLALLTLVNFLVALAMVHLGQDLPLVWPALALVALAAIFTSIGAGRYSIDALLAGWLARSGEGIEVAPASGAVQ